MSRLQRLAVFLLLMGAGAVAYAAQRRAAPAGELEQAPGQGGAWEWVPSWTWTPPSDSSSWPSQDVSFSEVIDMQANELKTIDPARNVAAFLQAIAQAEGTANQPDPYRVCFGYRHTIMSLREHPAITGEWRGEKLPDNQCRAAGFGPGCVSTAAGKYQIVRPTWERLRDRLKLRDFGPASQDAAARELLRESGALARIERGDLVGAISAARRTWASLPGAGYDQPERNLGYIQTAFLNAGGSLA